MEEEDDHSRLQTHPSSSSSSPPAMGDAVPSTSAGPSNTHLLDESADHQRRHGSRFYRFRRRLFRHRFSISISDAAPGMMSDDVWSCLVVLLTFWFFGSMTLILGLYGSVDLEVGPNYSCLITSNQLFVQSIKVQQIEQQVSGPLLYGFHKMPSLDVERTWSETHNASIQPNFHREWVFYLNSGSEVDISYDVKYPSSSPVSLVIAQGLENLIEWIDDPSYPNTTLSWNILYGSGRIEQEITQSATYYIALGNLNSEDVEVQLNFTMKALFYNTSDANFRCSLYSRACSFSLMLFKSNAVVLTSPATKQAENDDDWYIRFSYGPRWVTYLLGGVMMVAVVLLLFRFFNILPGSQGDGNGADNQEPLLSPKDDDLLSLGSSYDSVSDDGKDFEDWPLEEGVMQTKEGEINSNPQKLCVICFDFPRDCFFLPCGHCAACFTCGSRIAEEAGTCPICRRRMKKVRKIFSV